MWIGMNRIRMNWELTKSRTIIHRSRIGRERKRGRVWCGRLGWRWDLVSCETACLCVCVLCHVVMYTYMIYIYIYSRKGEKDIYILKVKNFILPMLNYFCFILFWPNDKYHRNSYNGSMNLVKISN
jgi:hypothetical protein